MTQKGCVFAADTHQGSVCRTYNSAFTRQCDTTGKHLDIIFLEAFGGAVLAFGCTLVTNLYTIAEYIAADYPIMHKYILIL